jgi:hypothetical protein
MKFPRDFQRNAKEKPTITISQRQRSIIHANSFKKIAVEIKESKKKKNLI